MQKNNGEVTRPSLDEDWVIVDCKSVHEFVPFGSASKHVNIDESVSSLDMENSETIDLTSEPSSFEEKEEETSQVRETVSAVKLSNSTDNEDNSDVETMYQGTFYSVTDHIKNFKSYSSDVEMSYCSSASIIENTNIEHEDYDSIDMEISDDESDYSLILSQSLYIYPSKDLVRIPLITTKGDESDYDGEKNNSSDFDSVILNPQFSEIIAGNQFDSSDDCSFLYDSHAMLEDFKDYHGNIRDDKYMFSNNEAGIDDDEPLSSHSCSDELFDSISYISDGDDSIFTDETQESVYADSLYESDIRDCICCSDDISICSTDCCEKEDEYDISPGNFISGKYDEFKHTARHRKRLSHWYKTKW